MSDHLDRLMRKVDMLEQDNKRLFARLDRVERAIDVLRTRTTRAEKAIAELNPELRCWDAPSFLED